MRPSFMNELFARSLQRRMRVHHVTIRELAHAMNITQTRVREARNHGTAPASVQTFAWQHDWMDGIQRAVELRKAALLAPPQWERVLKTD